MAALLCINAAAGSLPIPRRRASPYNAVVTVPVSANLPLRRRSLPTRGLVGEQSRATSRLCCAGTEASVAAAATTKEAEAVPLPPFEQSLVAVGSVSDEAATNKLGFKEVSTYVIYGIGAFFAGWIVSSVIESIPLLPRILEIVGLGYTIWFSTRYILFKEIRDELFAKAYDLKLKIIGSGDA